MTESLLVLIAVLALATLVMSVAVYLKLRSASADSRVGDGLASIPALVSDVAILRQELQRLEQNTQVAAHSQRQELGGLLTQHRNEVSNSISILKTENGESFGRLNKDLADRAEALRHDLNQRLDAAQQSANDLKAALNVQLAGTRNDITTAVTTLTKDNNTNLFSIAEKVRNQLADQGKDSRESMDKLKNAVEAKLTDIQTAAGNQLEKMRETVDEKLSSTLNTRLGESFKQVSDRLEAVQSGLGEMKSLAGNVTDLRRVMTNVKTRGVWGEVQLANLLDQIFTQEQYESNFRPKTRGGEVVEFALKLPGPEGSNSPVYLPIDSKFPIEDYQRLAEAADAGDVDGVKAAQKALENRIYGCAKDIRDKYIAVPTTTNFAVLFLPTEALYAEVVKMPGLLETLTREYKVLVQGPSTFAAFAMALLMGFRTLAIQKRSADIANLLGAVKSDFGKFAELLGKVEEKLDDAKTNIGKARQRSTQIVKKLGKVEELPPDQATLLLPDPAGDSDAIVAPDQD